MTDTSTVQTSVAQGQLRSLVERIERLEEEKKALAGDIDDLKPKHTPLYVAGLMARRSGGRAGGAFDGEKVRLALQFGDAAPAPAGALTAS